MTTAPNRLHGLDLARFVAFVGMVLVNFRIVMGAEAGGPAWLAGALTALEGRAAATFVVLAGVGLAMAYQRNPSVHSLNITLRRALFLFVAGLANALVFQADILHYYAAYFVIGVLCLRLPSHRLWTVILALPLIFVAMILVLDYDRGWDWTTLHYEGFWQPAGFVRNLLFNGWHPVIPWASFLLFGIWLGRLDLHSPRTARAFTIWGIAFAGAAQLASFYLVGAAEPELGQEIAHALLGTSPIAPMPLYMAAASATAAAVIGLCLLVSPLLQRARVLGPLTAAGRQTLTLYLAHILLGMGTLEALGMLGGQSLARAVLAAGIFSATALIYAWLWSRRFRRGPAEALMRRLAG